VWHTPRPSGFLHEYLYPVSREMKSSRVAEAIKILNASAEEVSVELKPKTRKSVAPKKAKKVTRKPRK